MTKRKDQGWDECRNPYKNTVAHWYQCNMCLYSNIYRNVYLMDLLGMKQAMTSSTQHYKELTYQRIR